MKKMFSILFVMLMSMTFTASGATKSTKRVNDVVIEQTIKFTDSEKELVIYYVKEKGAYSVYSETDLTKQKPSRLNFVESSSFKIVPNYKGKCFVTCKSVKEVFDLGFDLYNNINAFCKSKPLMSSVSSNCHSITSLVLSRRK